MKLSERAQAIKKHLDAYLETVPYAYNPDASIVARVLNGLAAREEKTGRRYCPCRLVTGREEADRAIVCPCQHHPQEIEERGACHCLLFVKQES